MTERSCFHSGQDVVSSQISPLRNKRMLVSENSPLYNERISDDFNYPGQLNCVRTQLTSVNGFHSKSHKKLQLEFEAPRSTKQPAFVQCFEAVDMRGFFGDTRSSGHKHCSRQSSPDRLVHDCKKSRRSQVSPLNQSPGPNLNAKCSTVITCPSPADFRGGASPDPAALHQMLGQSGYCDCVASSLPKALRSSACIHEPAPESVAKLRPDGPCIKHPTPKQVTNCQNLPLPLSIREKGVRPHLQTTEISNTFPPCTNSPSTAPSPNSSYTGSVPWRNETIDATRDELKQVFSLRTLDSDFTGMPSNLNRVRTPIHGQISNYPSCVPCDAADPELSLCKPFDNSLVYMPGIDLLVDGSDLAPLDLISRFSNTPVSSPNKVDRGSNGSVTPLDAASFSQLPDQLPSNHAQRPVSSPHTSSLSNQLIGADADKTTKTTFSQLRQQRKRMESRDREPPPALHLHLSKDGTSPLPPGWQRALNTKHPSSSSDKRVDSVERESSDMYAYYYYHVRTRQTRWDPPVYPWDADPMDTLSGDTGEDDPEAPYNWGCASKFAVTHDEIEAMYTRLRQRILERQCTDLLHELAGRPDAPQGAAEQSFAIELFTLVHNVLRTFRDARCKLGRIMNEEDLYYLTRKLSQSVILKEVQKLHNAQTASSTSLFAPTVSPEVTSSVQARVTAYVKRYMTSKGSYYVRRVQAPIPPVSLAHQQAHLPHVHSRMDNCQPTHNLSRTNSSNHPVIPGETTQECPTVPNPHRTTPQKRMAYTTERDH
ncbi:unnamed protein product [Dicrocoelium dendriticum]|nr:unnamed protein product [Dicrocoelium dendriticum]